MTKSHDASVRRSGSYAGVDRRNSSPSLARIPDTAPSARERAIFWAMIGCTVGAAVASIAGGDRSAWTTLLLQATSVLATGFSLVFSIRAALLSELDIGTRRCWHFISAAMAVGVFSIGLLVAAYYLHWQFLLRYRDASPLIPQFLLMIGLLQLPDAPRRRFDRLRMLLDIGTVVTGGLIVAWYDGMTGSWAHSSEQMTTALIRHGSLIADLVLLLLASMLWQRTSSSRRANVIGFLATAVCVHFASVGLFLLELRFNGVTSAWPARLAPLVVSCVAIAAWTQRTGGGRRRKAMRIFFRTASTSTGLIPYIAVMPGFVLLLMSAQVHGVQPLGGLAFGAVALAALAFGRQVVSARETIRLRTETMARDGEARFRALVQHSSDVITILDSDATIRWVSPSVAGVFGYRPDQLEGVRLNDLLHPEDAEGAVSFLDELATRQVPGERRGSVPHTLKREWRIRHADGSWHTVDNVGTNLVDEAVIGGLVLNTRDVTEQSVIREQYMHQAFHDPLTDLANRSLFLYQVGHALARATRQGNRVSVIFLDLDNFKNVNDSLGHAAGDRLLVEAARRLAACVRDTDVIARLGGDEFALLLEEREGEDEVDIIAERISAALSSPFNLSGKEVFVSASIGIARTTAGETSDELVRNADVAMYVAKNSGKGKHVLFEPQMHAAALERLVVEADLRRAIDRKEFFLEYQPIVVLQTGEICGAEALVRWACGERGTVPPGVFIPIAEETGLVVPIGQWVLHEACRTAKKWETELGRPMRITVNLSGRQLQEPQIVQHVREALEESGLPPQLLVLEITESMLMQHTDVSMARLTGLKSLGVSLAIDDFGTGYSSLGYLQRYPVDILKIDKTFVDAIDKGADGHVLASAIVALGETLRMNTVAEGIETEAQRGQLLKLGCAFGQGYLFAPALSMDEYARLIIARGVRSPLSLRHRVSVSERVAA